MPDEQPEAEAKRSLSAEQKTGFVFLLIFAVLGLSLGVLQIRNTMFAPFALNSNIPVTIKDEVNSVDALRYRDTDSDGLSDYDESYAFETSPYLFDTYGYGKSDKLVVAEGLARCPNAGRNCTDAGTPISPTSTPVAPLEGSNPADDFYKIATDPAELRSLLIKSGMEKEILDKLSDQELLSMVAQLMVSSTAATNTR